ncbi:hypothetical protein STXM2123_1495 [Streptomyces sp. F-3]|nr:hypothetical protein STXM2123_1495 [Streptomyces sp. F-3]
MSHGSPFRCCVLARGLVVLRPPDRFGPAGPGGTGGARLGRPLPHCAVGRIG